MQAVSRGKMVCWGLREDTSETMSVKVLLKRSQVAATVKFDRDFIPR